MRTPCDEAAIRSAPSEGDCGKRRQPWILTATILASSMAFIDGTIVNVAIPALQEAFHANIVQVQWVIESYALLLSALILVGGSLGDHYGRRRIFLAGVAVFAAASAACGFSATVDQLIVSRAIQGVGAALMVPGSLAIISASFDEQSRGTAIGTWSGFTAITTALGPVLGGWLIQHASWRWSFFINLPLAVAVIVISLLYVPETRSHKVPRVDLKGTLLVVLGLGGLVTGFVESPVHGWNSALLAMLLGGLSCLILFVWIEARERAPMVPLELFRSRDFCGANLLTLFLYAALSIFFFLYPMDLIQVHGFSATEAAAAALPMILLMSTLSRWAGGLVSKYGGHLPLIVGPLIAAAGFFIFAMTSAEGNYWNTFFPGFIVLGLGMTVTVAPLTTVVMNAVGPDRAGTASGINNAVSRIAGVLAVAILGLIMTRAFQARLSQGLAHLALPGGIVHQIEANSTRLAGINIPARLDRTTEEALRSVISDAFVFGFRLVAGICVTLAVVSAGFAARTISRKTT